MKNWGFKPHLCMSVVVAVGSVAVAAAVQAAPIKLLCACKDDQTPLAQELAQFMKANPDIQVESVDKGKYSAKLPVYAAAGTGPDLIWIDNQQAVNWGGQGIFMDLAPLVKRDQAEIQPDDFFPGAVANLSLDGADYALPSWMASSGLYYNKSLFDASAVAYPTDTWTWNDLIAAGKKLARQDASGKLTQWGYTPDGWSFNWSTGPTIWVWSNGGRIVSADQKKFTLGSNAARQALTTYYDVTFKDGFSYTPQDQNKHNWWDQFDQSKIAIWDSPSWNNNGINQAATQTHFSWGVAPTALSPYTHQRAAFTYVRGFAVLKSTKYPEAAFKLLKFLTSAKAAQVYAANGTQPARRSAANTWLDFTSNGQKVNLQPFIDAVAVGRYIPTLHNAKANSDFYGALGDAWNKVLNGQSSVQSFLDAVTPQVTQILSTENT